MFIRSNTVISSSYSEEIRTSHEDYFSKLGILASFSKIVCGGWKILRNIGEVKTFFNFS